jgi:hypothetical protein
MWAAQQLTLMGTARRDRETEGIGVMLTARV